MYSNCVDYFLYTSSNTKHPTCRSTSEIAQNQDYESEIDNINEIYSIAIVLVFHNILTKKML